LEFVFILLFAFIVELLIFEFIVDVPFVFVVDIGVALTTTATFEFIVFRLVLFAFKFEVFVLAVSPQAIPKAPSAKRHESAIIFLIDLLSFSKFKLIGIRQAVQNSFAPNSKFLEQRSI